MLYIPLLLLWLLWLLCRLPPSMSWQSHCCVPTAGFTCEKYKETMPLPCCVTLYGNTLTGKCVHARAGGPSCKTSTNLHGQHGRPRSCRQHYTSSRLIAQVQRLSGGAVTAGANNVIVFVFCLTNCLALHRKSDSVNRGFVHQRLRKLIIIDRQRSVKF